MRKHLHRRIARVGVMLGSLAVIQGVVADDQAASGAVMYPAGVSGLVLQLPTTPSAAELLAQVRALRADLRTESEALSTRVEETRFGAKDALIAAIMPGGLLYAAFRKHSGDQARKELETVSAELEELNHDLLALQVTTGEVLVADLR
jgi:hypothetical protein